MLFLDLDIIRGVVFKLILRVVGDELKKEIVKIFVLKYGSLRVRVEYGDVVEIMGYGLKCNRIFYGILYKWIDDKMKF